MQHSKLIDDLEAELPPIIPRTNVGKLTGGLVASKTLSNADAAGLGPKEKEVIYSKVVYSRRSFIDFLRTHFGSKSSNSAKK